MTKISKLLAVLVSAACFAFLGFALVLFVGGPNWQALSRAEDLGNYAFDRTTSEPPQWTVKRKRPEGNVGTATGSLAEAIIAARKDLDQRQKADIKAASDKLPGLEDELKQVRTRLSADRNALQAREKWLGEQYEALRSRQQEVSAETVKTTKAVHDALQTAKSRREDALRLQNQLEEIAVDRFRAEEQRRKLEILLIEVQAEIDRLERRNAGLKSAAAG